jgi:2-polyprenyl-3-methyl-5-hydroxy-6-metoxy-1,4-benzoquinol methylase
MTKVFFQRVRDAQKGRIVQATARHGVMDRRYAAARQDKRSRAYRYHMRACLVASYVRQYLGDRQHISLLDLGCADGLTMQAIASRVPLARALGIDCSADILGVVPPLPPAMRVELADATHLPPHITSERFDVVTALCFLEHLADPLLAMEQASRLLTPGGVFIAVWPTPMIDRVFMAMADHNEKYHLCRISRKKMFAMIKTLRLSIVCYERFQWFPFRVLSSVMPRWLTTNGIGYVLRAESALAYVPALNRLFVSQAVVCTTDPHGAGATGCSCDVARASEESA